MIHGRSVREVQRLQFIEITHVNNELLQVTCHFAPNQLVPAQLVRFQLAPDDNLSNAILSDIIKIETCPRFFDIRVEHNVGIKMKDFFVEQLSGII